MRRTSEGEMLLVAFLILFLLPSAAGAAVTTILPALVTRGFLAGVSLAWRHAYGSLPQYQSLYSGGSAAMNALVRRTASAGGRVARHELQAWLRVYDPLGLVRKAIEAGDVEDMEYLFDRR